MTPYQVPAPKKSGSVYCRAFGAYVFCGGTGCGSCVFRPPRPQGADKADPTPAEAHLSPPAGT